MTLEDIEKELYKKSAAPRRKKVSVSPKSEESEKTKVQESWKEFDEKKTKEPIWASSKITVGAIILVFLLVIGGSVFFIADYGKKYQSVRLEIFAPSEIERGVQFEVSVEITNTLDGFINQADLMLNLPSGFVYLSGLNGGSPILNETVGDLGSGSFSKKTFKFLAIGAVNSLEKVSAVLSYRSGGKNRFKVETFKEVLIKTSAVNLEVKKPERILPGSPLDLDMTYKNNSQFDFPDIALEVKYPSSFKYLSASLPPDKLNNYWELGELRAGSTGDLQVKGIFPGTSEGKISLPVVIYANILGKNYPIVEEIITVGFAASPIDLEILLNRRSDYIARIGDVLNYTLHYENRSGIALADVVIKAILAGEIFDFGTLSSDAGIDSVTNTLTWTASKVPALKLLDPGVSGEVSFRVGLKNAFPIRRLSDKNFTLRVQAEIDSPSVPYYLEASKTSALTLLETKIAGQVMLDASAFYRDAASSLTNAGVLPPKVNQPTEYTVHWAVKNFGTDIRDVKISAFLESGVSWTGFEKSNIDSVPLYNERTKEVVWQIPKILATKGVISAPVEAVFQVRAIPDVTQIGQFQPLLTESALNAVDDFTGLEFTSRDVGLTTALPDDRTVGQEGGRVVQ